MNPIRIFISSVQSEFSSERKNLCDYIRSDALLGRFFVPFIFEELPATDKTAQRAFLEEVVACDIYIGLFGALYGNVKKNETAATELEYDLASQNNKHRLIYIKNTETRDERETALIAKAEKSVVRRSFSTYEELRGFVYASLVRFLEEKEYIRILPFDATFHPTATLNDIDDEKVQFFVDLAQAKRRFPVSYSAGISAVLMHLNLLSEDFRLTNAALLLFAKKPQAFFIASEVKCVQFYGNEITKPMPSYHVYHGNVFQLIDQAVDFVMSRINARVGSREKKTDVDVDYELPLKAVREAIVNAVTHRDYTSNGSVQVMLFRNRLEIWNPGSLPYGLTTAKLLLPHPSVPTNPILAHPIYLAGYIEKVGTGTSDMMKECVKMGLRKPEFIQDEEFKVILWRNPKESEGANEGISEGTNEGIKIEGYSDSVVKELMKLHEYIKTNPHAARADLIRVSQKGPSSVERYIRILKENGLIRFEGSRKSGNYIANKGLNDGINKGISKGLNDGLKIEGYSGNVVEELIRLYEYIKTNPHASMADLMKISEKGQSTVERYIRILKEYGLVAFEGSKKTGGYIATK